MLRRGGLDGERNEAHDLHDDFLQNPPVAQAHSVSNWSMAGLDTGMRPWSTLRARERWRSQRQERRHVCGPIVIIIIIANLNEMGASSGVHHATSRCIRTARTA